ncbi:zinc finger MYM-type protein 1-like [Dendrobium catenatum]|uniref:zinc finger MYM-type protein 1-like n=1 Tax=Dendrobium catenatum TaxID=906689 RepID=UPI0009F70F20|nr:zinc finger MYM-type protein 1-like [Dendrobium catenatum]
MLTAAIDCVRFLLRPGLSFRGHDESSNSENRVNYLELFDFLADHNEKIKTVTSAYANSNLKLNSPKVQKEICVDASAQTLTYIMKDIDNSYFSLIVDESRDVSTKEQVAISMRYVDRLDQVIERFIGIKHVTSTNAVTLKAAIEDILAKHSLSIQRMRGQGYDGASNMRGEFHGLKALILKDNPQAFYVHCFAHQLQLCLVAVTKNHWQVKHLFEFSYRIINTIGASCKRSDAIKCIQHDKILLYLKNGNLISGKGLNQEINLQKSSDTRWSSHFHSLISLMRMYASVIEVLEIIKEEVVHDQQSVEADVLIDIMEYFDFIFIMHLMIDILGITNELSQSLQRKDQDIENKMKLVQISKQRLQLLRENGWNALLDEVSHFCGVFEVVIPNMNEIYKTHRRSVKRGEDKTNLHHYRVDLFYTVVDMQLQELNNRFSESSTELLLYVSCLNPSDSFHAYDERKLICLAELYPSDFSIIEIVALKSQLSTYIIDMQTIEEFSSLRSIDDLAKQIVKFKKNDVYPLVYRLIILALTLPVATATVERAFSAMKIIKYRLHSRMGDDWLNDCLVPYIEKDVFDMILNKDNVNTIKYENSIEHVNTETRRLDDDLHSYVGCHPANENNTYNDNIEIDEEVERLRSFAYEWILPLRSSLLFDFAATSRVFGSFDDVSFLSDRQSRHFENVPVGAIVMTGARSLSRQPLEAMFTSTQWLSCAWAKKAEGKEIRKIVLNDRFWQSVLYAVTTTRPLVHVLRMVDAEKKPAMGFIYNAMDEAK